MSQESFMIFLHKNHLKFYFNFGNLYLRDLKKITYLILNFSKMRIPIFIISFESLIIVFI